MTGLFAMQTLHMPTVLEPVFLTKEFQFEVSKVTKVAASESLEEHNKSPFNGFHCHSACSN